ncbi:hypothetical protein Poli38472_011306 [Pythium oligandrum]|uniref:EF-hand domain-containing protein n=1 Tax=Pythium oligandrum TaxID=41045 RepID=A0A8K1CQ04_PYTOL|nr:hypothetical protein Poli38472_011306 [Pythium oligandrum]|eukprot:TMW67686.1 hypothetical protein Poli38472_011306 [Pythium oligandrum]
MTPPREKPIDEEEAEVAAPEQMDVEVDIDADPYSSVSTPRMKATKSMRIRMHKQKSDPSGMRPKHIPHKFVSKVKRKIKHLGNPRVAFRTDLRLAVRIALGVLLAGVAQTRAPEGSSKHWFFMPESYIIGGLNWAAIMVIFAASRTIGGAIQQMWQIAVGMVIALLFNMLMFSLIPMNQEKLIKASLNLRGEDYWISVQDWGHVVPLLLAFTFIVFLSPMEENVKKFAVSTNLYFMLTIVSPMNPIYPTQLKETGPGWFSVHNLVQNFAWYSVVGIIGTFISLATMVLPYPLVAIRMLKNHIHDSPFEIREILNVIVDTYCFRARDIREMDFFQLKLDRLMKAAQKRLETMQELLDDSWWEEIVGGGWLFRFNKTVAKQYIRLYAKLLIDLQAMRLAIEKEACASSHSKIMSQLQRRIYLLQVETNDLLEAIAANVLTGSRAMPTSEFNHLELSLENLLHKYTRIYGDLLSTHQTSRDVSSSMPMNLFLYSFHTLVQTLFEFERTFNEKNYSSRYRMMNFLKLAVRSFCTRASYPRSRIIFTARTTVAVFVGVVFSTFIFGFSSTVPNAIAMVAQYRIGGTYGNIVNRISGLIAGTVIPSIFSFFICKSPSNILYNAINNIVLFVWTSLSMYVYYSGSYISSAGMISAFMAASVLIDHSCRSQTGFKALSYSSLTENSLGILILLLLEAIFQPQSARKLVRKNISDFLSEYSDCLDKILRHHMAMERGISDHEGMTVLDTAAVKELRRLLMGTLATKLEDQTMLLKDAALEPDLWRHEFSHVKYTHVHQMCETLLSNLRILLDLVDWHESRRVSRVDITLQQPTPIGSKRFFNTVNPSTRRVLDQEWCKAQDDMVGALSSALDTLVALYSEQFSNTNAEDTAIFMQMKEAFRLADVHRHGEVDASELAVLLERLLPYQSVQENKPRLDQYVAEFMRLVDRDGNGKISYTEFMDALNRGFRLELEIYEEVDPTTGLFRQASSVESEESRSLQSKESGESDATTAPSTGRSVITTANGPSFSPLISSTSVARLPASSRTDVSLRPDTLLNVESFPIKDAARKLREAYGAYLIVETKAHHVAVEDFILMSCLITTMDEIAAALTTLSSLAAT